LLLAGGEPCLTCPLLRLALLVTLVTIHAVVHISAHVGVTEIRRVPAAMTIRTLEHRVIARIRMTRRADPVRIAVVHVEVRVIKGRPRPCRRGVAGRARIRETG